MKFPRSVRRFGLVRQIDFGDENRGRESRLGGGQLAGDATTFSPNKNFRRQGELRAFITLQRHWPEPKRLERSLEIEEVELPGASAAFVP